MKNAKKSDVTRLARFLAQKQWESTHAFVMHDTAKAIAHILTNQRLSFSVEYMPDYAVGVCVNTSALSAALNAAETLSPAPNTHINWECEVAAIWARLERDMPDDALQMALILTSLPARMKAAAELDQEIEDQERD